MAVVAADRERLGRVPAARRRDARSLVETGGRSARPAPTTASRSTSSPNGVDCAIVGLGTCGSCTTFTIKDAVAVEEHEKPVVAIVAEEFDGARRTTSRRHLGHGDLKVLVLPYPLEARPEDELRAIADEYYPQVLELLGVTA